MEASNLEKIAEYGVGIVAILVLGYILYNFISSHKKELDESRQERQKNQEWFMGYIQENNHRTSEMVAEHTKAVVQVNETLGQHVEILKDIRGEIRK